MRPGAKPLHQPGDGARMVGLHVVDDHVVDRAAPQQPCTRCSISGPKPSLQPSTSATFSSSIR